jgi:hypothetical protein
MTIEGHFRRVRKALARRRLPWADVIYWAERFDKWK